MRKIDAQGKMRHSRASTTLDTSEQFVPESQQRVVAKAQQPEPFGSSRIEAPIGGHEGKP